MAQYGEIPSNITMSSGQAIRRNAADNAFEAYTPSAGGGIAASLSGNTAGVLANISTGTMYLAGGDNVTLSQNANSVTISGANQSVQTQNMVSINGSTGAISLATGSSLSSSSNGSTITFGLASNITTALQSAGAYLTTAAQSNQVINSINGSTGTFSFNTGSSLSSSRVGNAVTWGLASNITTALQSAGAYLTTAMASNRGTDFVQATAAFAGTNASGTIASNGISVSVAPPGAAAENNNMQLAGNTAGNTTASGSTIQFIGGNNITLSGTNGSQIRIDAGGGGGNLDAFFEPYPYMNPISTTYAPGLGTWHFQALKAPVGLASGRMNALFSMGSTSNLLAASNGTSWASGSTGGISYSFRLDRTAALYSCGTGTNSTRLESFWSNTITNGVSQSVGVSLTNASQLTVARSVSFQYVQSVETNGLYTTAGLGATHNASFANSSTATSAATSAISSIMNMMSGAMLVPFGFNTTISQGDYWLGIAYSTASTTAGTSVNGASIWPQVNQVGLYGAASMSHRQFGATVSNTSSQFMPGHAAIYSIATASAPANIPFRDLRSVASHVIPYVNFMKSVAS